ncbi:MAG: hypothetical protein ABII72_00740 [Parcubacteria group bacterium]
MFEVGPIIFGFLFVIVGTLMTVMPHLLLSLGGVSWHPYRVASPAYWWLTSVLNLIGWGKMTMMAVENAYIGSHTPIAIGVVGSIFFITSLILGVLTRNYRENLPPS